MYKILPHKYRDLVNVDENTTIEKYYQKLKCKINIKAYLEDWINKNKNQGIAINYMGKTKFNKHYKNYKNYCMKRKQRNLKYQNKNKNRRYCHICEKFTHDTKRCI